MSWGHLIDLRHGVPEGNELGAYVAAIDEVDFEDDTTQFKCTVYNIEAEDTHTYYAGTKGVWVRNTGSAELAARKTAPAANEVIPSNRLDLSFTKGEAKKPNSGKAFQIPLKSEKKLADVACFVAGTLVHTKEGLIPIENIKIGDWVLSQPERQGELAYKCVVKTMEFEDHPVWRVSYCKTGTTSITELNEAKGIDDNQDAGTLVVTGNHPFWMEGYLRSWPEEERGPIGWVRADHLVYGSLLKLVNGELVRVLSCDRLWRTATEGIAWIELNRDSDRGYPYSVTEGRCEKLVPLSRSVKSDFADDIDFCLRHEHEGCIDQWAYKCTVYNFEVEDFHTYYVGKFGVWVHTP
jgi:hypothetical protein